MSRKHYKRHADTESYMRLFIPYWIRAGYPRDFISIGAILASMDEDQIPHTSKEAVNHWLNRDYSHFITVFDSMPKYVKECVSNDMIITKARNLLSNNLENLTPELQAKVWDIAAQIKSREDKLKADIEFNNKKLELESKKVETESQLIQSGSPFALYSFNDSTK